MAGKSKTAVFTRASDFKRRVREVRLKSLGASIRLMDVSVREVRIMQGLPEGERTEATLSLIAKSVVDEADKPIFTAESVGDLSAAVVMELARVITGGLASVVGEAEGGEGNE
jgi:hypothetical protein